MKRATTRLMGSGAMAALLLLISGPAMGQSNIDPNNALAWGENIGWINFDTSGVSGPTAQVTIDMVTGDFSGFAWAENVGWINFGHDYGVSFLPASTSVDDWMLVEY